MSDLFKNHIVGFPVRRLICVSEVCQYTQVFSIAMSLYCNFNNYIIMKCGMCALKLLALVKFLKCVSIHKSSP